jgi:tRNA pseudouridine38-40 synthase
LYLGAVYYPEHYGINKHLVFDKLPGDARRHD